MKTSNKIKIAALLMSASLGATANTYAENNIDDYAAYCKKSGGVVEDMKAEIGTRTGLVTGLTKKFCNFTIDGGFVAVGLETFASQQPNIAATFIKKMNEVGKNSLQGPYGNPSVNFCKNIGGSSISFIGNGGFSNQLGQNDICVFGDGSMVSGWSLIYIANNRAGYDVVKNQVRSDALNIPLPR